MTGLTLLLLVLAGAVVLLAASLGLLFRLLGGFLFFTLLAAWLLF